MKLRGAWWILLILLMVCVIAGIFTVIPLNVSIEQRCPVCGAKAYSRRYVLIPVPLDIREGSLSRYWLTSVDPHHKHEWIPLEGFRTYLAGWGHSTMVGWSHPRWMLPDDCAVAVLKSLPTVQARRNFVRGLWRSGVNLTSTDERDIETIVYYLQEAWASNPRRGDWLTLLRDIESNNRGKSGRSQYFLCFGARTAFSLCFGSFF